MKHTMRSAFKRWCILHNEEKEHWNNLRIPNWFRHYVRTHIGWSYTVHDERIAKHCNLCEMDYDERRKFKGNYSFEISDEELLKLERPEWVKESGKFENGDKVYHKKIKKFGTFVKYDRNNDNECHILFDGYGVILHVTIKELIIVK